jgi:hypothetical protein
MPTVSRTTPSKLPLHRWTVGVNSGMGIGEPGTGIRFGLTTEYWPTRYFGAGVQAVNYVQSEFFGGPAASLLGIGPALTARVPFDRVDLRFALGAGRGNVKYQADTGGILHPPGRVQHYVSTYFTANGGVVWRGSSFGWISTFACTDVVVEPDSPFEVQYLLSANLALGLTLW